MKTELVDVSPTRKEIRIQIEPEVVRAAYDRISDQYAKKVNVPGFRRGHAPPSVVRTRFKNEIRGDVLRQLVPDAISDAIDKHELATIGEPDIHVDDAENLTPAGDNPLSFQVNIEVLPKIELGNYKGLTAVRRRQTVTEAAIDGLIERLREASASLEPVEDRGAVAGDTLSVNFHGRFLDEPEREAINVDDVDVTLAGPGVQPEFTENLSGAKVDEQRIFTVNYAPDHSATDLAGKRVEYTATVTAVRRKELPDVDDEWAKSLGEEIESLEVLRTKIREDLDKNADAEADHRLRNEVLAKLLEAHQFEVPETLINHQANHRLESVVRDMIGRGIDPRHQQLDWEGAREDLKLQATEDVRSSLLLERIAEQEKIEVTEAEIEAEIEAISKSTRQPKEQVRGVLTKEGGERSIANRLRNRKALDLLTQSAHVTEVEWTEPEKDDATTQNSEST